MYLVTDMCEHGGAIYDFTNHADRIELRCRACGRSQTQRYADLRVTKVDPDECLRMARVDFTPYCEAK